MGTVWIREFTGGLDTRRLPETSPGGTLMRLRDAHINRGGEIEQRAIFEKVYSLPVGETKGMAHDEDGLVVFGHQAPPQNIDPAVKYQQLEHPNGRGLRRVRDVELFSGKLQVIGEFEDDSAHMFYDGVRVNDSEAPPLRTDSGNPRALLTDSSKMFVASGPNVFFSAISDSTDFGNGSGIGSGFVVMSTHAQGAGEIMALGQYDELVAVFAERVIMTWYFDPDPALTRKAQVLNNTGTLAPRSITQFGDGDLFYLDRSGIRSLRARDSSNSAATTDIGSPIDTLINDNMCLRSDCASKAIGLIEPRDGRFWLSIRDRIYVFSYFFSSKVSAWSEYLPGFDIDDMLSWDSRVWLRSGDDIHVYGGADTSRYEYSEDVEAEVWLPYLDADEPFRAKRVSAVNAAVRGTWEFSLALDPNNQEASDLVARIDQTTYPLLGIDALGETTHFSPRLRSKAPPDKHNPAIISTVVVHFDRDQQEDR